jgi:hypothetical protein
VRQSCLGRADPGACATTRARSFAFGRRMPWKRIRCRRGRGTRAAPQHNDYAALNRRVRRRSSAEDDEI